MSVLQRLTIPTILKWADVHHRRTGSWPNQRSGVVTEAKPLTWQNVHSALYAGGRGLPGGSSLAQLLDKERGVENYANPRPVSVQDILKWAKAHQRRTSEWPHKRSGAVVDAPFQLTWATLDTALHCGSRGLPSKTSLAALLEKHLHARTRRHYPPVTTSQILRWADEHLALSGQWPTSHDNKVKTAEGESWQALDKALRVGTRGLPGGSSLARLLVEHRPISHKIARGGRVVRMPGPRRARISMGQILAWADAHHKRTGEWPRASSGTVREAPLWTWGAVNTALTPRGSSAIPGVRSLSSLLRRERGVWDARGKATLSEDLIVRWAKAHRQRTGRWPDIRSGKVQEAPRETWARISSALNQGARGLRKGSSLRHLLRPLRVQENDPRVRPLTVNEVLRWADEHRARTGDWPTPTSGRIRAEPARTWQAIHAMLVHGRRGLPGRTTLVQLLQKHRGRRNQSDLPRLTVQQILAWADAHRKRTGLWPHEGSGKVVDAPQESWKAIDTALTQGIRGLPGGTTLNRFLVKHRGKRDPRDPPPLSIAQILRWADAFHEERGKWPHNESGRIPDVPGESWWTIDHALKNGLRGLPGRSSLLRLLVAKRGMWSQRYPPNLTIKQILQWADEHYETTGEWPSRESGCVLSERHERWSSINDALKAGRRGLPGGSSLVQLLSQKRASRYRQRGMPLSIEQILEWAAEHHELTGRLPTPDSGEVRGQAGENWKAIDAALRYGSRNLRGKSSLAHLLKGRYTPPYPGIGQRLTEEKILKWAEDFRERAGEWPTSRSAYVFAPPAGRGRARAEYRGEQWSTIDIALREGLRGLKGGSSLRDLLQRKRRVERV